MSEALQEAGEILRNHRQEMERRLDAIMPRSGTGCQVRGSYPVYVVSAIADRTSTEESFSQPFQLKYVRDGRFFSFTKGRVQAGSSLVIPTIGGIPINTEPPPTLPVVPGGTSVFAKYRWTLDPVKTAPDWLDVFASCELIQSPTIPADVIPSTGLIGGVSATEGVSHAFLMAYDGQGQMLTYGMNAFFPPDPDDLFPSDYVVLVFPLVRYVT